MPSKSNENIDNKAILLYNTVAKVNKIFYYLRAFILMRAPSIISTQADILPHGKLFVKKAL